MRGVLTVFGAAVAAATLVFPGVAGAATRQHFNDVPAGFWAKADVNWAVSSGWMTPAPPRASASATPSAG